MPRIASCSLKGLPGAKRNRRRRQLLHEIARGLEAYPPVDAVVLPGGYFVEKDKRNAYLDRSFEGRCDLLRQAEFADDATAAVRTLDDRHKGALLIFGVDTDGAKSPMGDQLCVAWSTTGPLGIGRKVFPTEYEGAKGFIVNVEDYGSKERVVHIGGAKVLLCACYDGYGILNQPDKSTFVSHISSSEGRLSRIGELREFRACLRGGLSAWRELVRTVDAAVVSIHRFEQTKKDGFSTNYWRRHGIANASAARHGGWCVAGANFEGRLPHAGVDILAAQDVPSDYLTQGNSRTTQDAAPLEDYAVGDGEVRIRLFDFSGGQAQRRRGTVQSR